MEPEESKKPKKPELNWLEAIVTSIIASPIILGCLILLLPVILAEKLGLVRKPTRYIEFLSMLFYSICVWSMVGILSFLFASAYRAGH